LPLDLAHWALVLFSTRIRRLLGVCQDALSVVDVCSLIFAFCDSISFCWVLNDSTKIPARLSYIKSSILLRKTAVIRDKVYRALSYLSYAHEAGWQGTARMCFYVNRDGKVEKLQILKSSGYQLLDKNAVKANRQAAPFPYAPVKLQIIFPVGYRLE